MPLVERLLALEQAEQIELAVTRTIRQDVPDRPLAEKIDQLPELGIRETGAVARFGTWTIGVDHLGSAGFEEFRLRLESERQRGDPRLPDIRDWDHLHAHMVQGRDVFLTRDGPIKRPARLLYQEFGIRIMGPEEYLDEREKTRQDTPTNVRSN